MEVKEQVVLAQGIRFSVCENGTEVAHAYLYLGWNDLHPGKPFGFLEDVFVEPNHRGGGFFLGLMRQITGKAKESGCYKLIATSRFERSRVHQLYLRIGFREHGKEFRMDFET